MEAFRSRYHPGGASYALVLAGAQALPVAAVFLVIILVSTAAALEGLDILGPLLWIVPAAYAVAASAGALVAQRRIAEVVVADGHVALRSPLDVAAGRAPRWERLHSSRLRNEGLVLGVGDHVRTLSPRAWPEFPRLRQRLSHASMMPDAPPPA